MTITFDATVGSRSNSYWSFGMPFCMEWMTNRYSVMMTSGRDRLEQRFEKAITFDATVVSRSNSYWSFWMPFCMEWMTNRYSMMMRSSHARLD